MNWLLLIVAGLFETCFAFCLSKANLSVGLEKTWWYIGFAISLFISMTLLMKAVQTLPIGTAYAVWTGIGAVGSVLVGILYFGESATFLRLFFLTTLILSIIGLKFVTE